MVELRIIALVLLLIASRVSAFRPPARLSSITRGASALQSTAAISLESYSGAIDRPEKWIELMSKPVNPGLHTKIKGKLLNMWGVMYAVITFAVAVAVLPMMMVMATLSDLLGNKKVRRSTPSITNYNSFPP